MIDFKGHMIDFRLYLITDRTLCSPVSLGKTVAEACRSGVRAVQLREKDLSGGALYGQARELRKVTRCTESKLFINDRVDIALAVGADGIHCPENGLPIDTVRRLYPEAMVGASAHSLERATEAGTCGAAFILFGPVFPTPSKAKYGDPMGLKALSIVAKGAGRPVFAVGGITPENAHLCLENGATGVGVVSAIMSASNISEVIGAFRNTLGGL